MCVICVKVTANDEWDIIKLNLKLNGCLLIVIDRRLACVININSEVYISWTIYGFAVVLLFCSCVQGMQHVDAHWHVTWIGERVVVVAEQPRERLPLLLYEFVLLQNCLELASYS